VARHINRFVDIGVEYFTLGFVPINTAKETIRRMRIFADGVMSQLSDLAAGLCAPAAVAAVHDGAGRRRWIQIRWGTAVPATSGTPEA